MRQNKYRSRFIAEEAEYIKEARTNGIRNKSELSRELREVFPSLKSRSLDWMRKAIDSICREFEEEAHRGEAINGYSEESNTLPSSVKHARHKTTLSDWSKISSFIKNPQYLDEEKQQLEELRDNILEDITTKAPIYPIINRTKNTDGHLLIVSATDIHLGKLCDEYDTWNWYNESKAYEYAIECVKWLLDKAKWFDIDKIVFIGGNDILHIDSPQRKTTAGTPQDTAGMRHSNARLWVKLYTEILEMLLPVADVHFVFCPSNHDYTHWWFMCQIVEWLFSNNKNITFDSDLKHRKYMQYGNSLIMFSHWDGAKEGNLWMLMSVEAKEMRTDSVYRYWYLWHVHHRIAKEYVNITIEYTRSISWTDTRHHNKWYKSSQAMEAYVHSKNKGQIAKFTHYI
jgi:hypothetical protein